MSDLSDTIKGFYSDFILRDLLSFVTPGAIVFVTLILAILKIDISTIWGQTYIVHILSQISIIIWILLFGLFYLIGLGLQILGSEVSFFTMKNFNLFDLLFPMKDYDNKFRKKTGLPQGCKNGQNHTEEHLSIPFDLDKKYRYAKYYHCMRLRFLACSNIIEKKTHERFIVLMQSSGNCAIAFFLSSIISLYWITTNTRFSSFLIPWIFFCFIFSGILYFGFKDLRQKVFDWEQEVIKRHDRRYHHFSNDLKSENQ